MRKQTKTTACPRCRENGGDTRGNNLVVYDDGGYHCFACGYHKSGGFVFQKPSDVKHDNPLLPADFQREVPAMAWKWLLRYGLPMSYWKPFVGWSEKYSRLVFTVGDPTCFSIGRYIESSPEVRSESGSLLRSNGARTAKWFVWGDSHRTAVSIGKSGEKTVFVEDIVSAHKVGRVGQAIPIFGTAVHPAHLRLAKYLGKPIVLWLDKDQQGHTMKKANMISMYTGLSCEVLHTDQDPKELDLQLVKEMLNA